ncbi:LuxR family transcriptional regulator [Microbulbifer flavimaris]|uniref:LuxR family transcriptional regulator n=1 Tax=Microbulbifer flavimaris TaxID=1781068 RepID=A0ABX4I0Q1_9GAMM|nr:MULTISPECIES: LuxR C-terminal-related transcriptional regulator [Microbulbifer]KUJ83809.1 hypothetical protein AVO43_08260 [Microbulbifer sp. ZGT114]PCO05985.1 LuxR family transcriptional regulator [Microbulbifer flavimaris]
MKPTTHALKSVWDAAREHLSAESADNDLVQLDNRLASAFCCGPNYHFVLDFSGMQPEHGTPSIRHVSPSIKSVLGLDPGQVVLQDILDRMHPDDTEFVARAEQAAFDFIYGRIAADKRPKYKVSYCFRFKTAEGNYQLFNHQAMILTTDPAGRLARSLCIQTNIQHLTEQNNHCISVIGMSGEPSYLNLDISQMSAPTPVSGVLFTEREMEVIRLMSKGLTSRDIAKTLCIAANTVKNHRKNILNKSGCRNAGELITRCITEGIL